MATDVSHLNTNSTLIPTTDLHPPEWHEARKLGLGGSEPHHLFPQESQYGCPLQLWYEKTGHEKDFGRTEDEQKILDRGNELEDIVAEKYMRETGRKVRRMPTRVSKEYPWMRVNVDRQIVNDERGPGVLECKTANQFVFKKMLYEGLPIAYLLQIQHAMAVTGYTWGSFAVLETSSWQFIQFEIPRDETMIELLVRKEAEFWQMVQNGVQPEKLPDVKDKRCSACAFRKTCRGEKALLEAAGAKDAIGVEYEDDDSLAELANDWKTAQFTADDYQAVADQIKDQLKSAIGDRSAVAIPSAGLKVLYKQQKGRTTWDGKGLEAELPGIARHVAFADYIEDNYPALVAEFMKLVNDKKLEVPDLTDKFRKVGAGSRPFRPIAI